MSARLPLMLGTMTPWGHVAAVLSLAGPPRERYYHLIDAHGCVSMFPADMVEDAVADGTPTTDVEPPDTR